MSYTKRRRRCLRNFGKGARKILLTRLRNVKQRGLRRHEHTCVRSSGEMALAKDAMRMEGRQGDRVTVNTESAKHLAREVEPFNVEPPVDANDVNFSRQSGGDCRVKELVR